MKKRVNGFNAAPGPAVWAASILLAFAFNSATAGPPQPQPPKYTVIELKPLPGAASAGVLNAGGVLNNRGQVVGGSGDSSRTSAQWCIWQNGMVTPLPPGPAAVNGAHGINESGGIVGIATTPDWDNAQAYVLVRQHWVQLPALDATYCNAQANGINNPGTIIGTVWKNLGLGGNEPPLPVVWRDGKIEPLPILDLGPGHIPAGDPWAINDLGQIVGRSGDWFFDETGTFHTPYQHATLWEEGQAIDISENHDYSLATDINNDSVATGVFMDYTLGFPFDFPERPFVWTKETGLVDLGTPPGYPYAIASAINAGGEIVGEFAPVFTELGPQVVLVMRAALWKDGMVYDLNACVPAGSGWNLYSASAINARGQIVAFGVNSTGAFSVFLLNPQ